MRRGGGGLPLDLRVLSPGGAVRRHACQARTPHARCRRLAGSTFHHTLIFSLKTGRLTFNGTHQGYSNTSTWSRGQAWALAGFALAYEAAPGEQLFLATARRAADCFLKHLLARLCAGTCTAARGRAERSRAGHVCRSLQNLDLLSCTPISPPALGL